MLKSFGITDKGKVRKDNQDSFIIEKCEAKNCMVVALCDGMGGAKAGGLASQISNKAFVSYIYAKLTSRTNRVVDYSRVLSRPAGTGTGRAHRSPAAARPARPPAEGPPRRRSAAAWRTTAL